MDDMEIDIIGEVEDYPALLGLMRLDKETRGKIFDMVLEDTILKATEPTVAHSSMGMNGNLDEEEGLSRVEPLALCLVSRDIYNETKDRYHNKITYAFPSCLSFLDVLSRWTYHKIRALQRVYIRATPIILSAPGRTPFMAEYHDEEMIEIGATLDLFKPDLRIEKLWIEDAIHFEGRGFPLDKQHASTGLQIHSLLLCDAWKGSLEYISAPMDDRFFVLPTGQPSSPFVESLWYRPSDRDELAACYYNMHLRSETQAADHLARHTSVVYRASRDPSTDYMSRKVPVPEFPSHALQVLREKLELVRWSRLRAHTNIVKERSRRMSVDLKKFPLHVGPEMRNGGVR